MCGIVGWISRGSVDVAVLERMRDTIAHRGPDAVGTWIDPAGRIGLGHRRLAVIDLSPAGAQPLWHHSGRCVIVFNGEIYNYRELRAQLTELGHRFVTATDTEVILAAYLQWGSSFVERLNGMFAFGLYDREAGVVWLARDRVGKKPLYYSATGTDVIFASELRALRAHPRISSEPDLHSLNEYLARGCIGDGRSMISGVAKLPAGHLMKVSVGALAIERSPFWTLPRPQPSASAARVDELAPQLGSLLQKAVSRRLIADVPLGILLSGGVDSTLITAAAARGGASAGLRTFTIVNSDFNTGGETERARRIAGLFGTTHTELDARDGELSLDDALAAGDEPNGDSSFIPTLIVSRLARQHVTVALGGDGGDELFGGYEHYRRTLRYVRTLGRVPRWVRAIPAGAAGHLPLGTRGRSALKALAFPADQVWARRTTFFDAQARKEMFRRDALDALGHDLDVPERRLVGEWRTDRDLVSRMTIFDFEHFLRDDVLAKVDRASMAVSLEVRCPWLDPEIVDFTFAAVPAGAKVTETATRLLPRRLLSAWLPGDLDFSRKQGFSVPLETWLRTRWSAELRRPMEALDRWLRPGYVAALADGLRKRRSNGARWYALAALDAWCRASSPASVCMTRVRP